MQIRKAIIQSFRVVKLLPHSMVFKMHKDKEIIHYETKRWMQILKIEKSLHDGFIFLMINHPEFRNLFYYRIGRYANLISPLCKRMDTLFIMTAKIGPGLFIQHGFATIISAKEIGKDCWVNQQVTLGHTSETDHPIIKDNVVIFCGAKVLGNVTVGSNSIVGANAVVVKNVPENCTVVGVPAYIVKRNGVKTLEKL